MTTFSELPSIEGSGNLPDQVATRLEQAIIEGVLEPGQRLSAENLAQHFGVSRIPVREALRALHTSGWVHIEPRLGVYVSKRDPDEFRDLFEVRLFLEEHAARLAAARRTDAQLTRLDEMVAQGHAAADSGDPALIGRMNTDFHEALVSCTGNTVLSKVLRGLSQRVRWYYSAVSNQRGRHSMAEHAELVEAIRSQESERAGELIRRHIETTRQAVERLVG